MDKKTKIIIIAAIVAGLSLLVIDGKLGEADCSSNGYDQTTGMCREGK